MSPVFDILSGSKQTRLSLKERKFIFFTDGFHCRRRRPCLRFLLNRIRRVSGAIGTGFVLLFTSRCVNLKYNFLGWVTCQEISNSESEVNIFPGFTWGQ